MKIRFAYALVLLLVLAPRVYLWGTVPVSVHGDEAGFSAVGAQPPTARFLMLHGCGHGVTQLALHRRPCEDIAALPATIAPHTTVIAFPTAWAPTAAGMCRAAGLPTYEVQWASAPAVVCGDAVVMPQ